MYLWKYWRESRNLFAGSLLAVAVLMVAILHEHLGGANHHNPDIAQLWNIWSVFLSLQILPLCFTAWIFGGFGVGHDLGERSGSFVFSRPRSRAWFMWRDWSFGLSQILFIAICLNLAGWLQVHRVLVAVGDPGRNFALSQSGALSIAPFAGLTCTAAFLLAALVFSLTYFSTILIKNARGIFVSAGVVLGYHVLGAVVQHYWPSVELPSLLLQAFVSSNHTVHSLANHLGLDIAIRAGIVLFFPFAAQFVLERTDI